MNKKLTKFNSREILKVSFFVKTNSVENLKKKFESFLAKNSSGKNYFP